MDSSPPGSSIIGFFRQEYLSGLPFPPQGDLPDPGTEPFSPASPALQADCLPAEPLDFSFFCSDLYGSIYHIKKGIKISKSQYSISSFSIWWRFLLKFNKYICILKCVYIHKHIHTYIWPLNIIGLNCTVHLCMDFFFFFRTKYYSTIQSGVGWICRCGTVNIEQLVV